VVAADQDKDVLAQEAVQHEAATVADAQVKPLARHLARAAAATMTAATKARNAQTQVKIAMIVRNHAAEIDATIAQTHAVKNLDAQIHAVEIDATIAQTHVVKNLDAQIHAAEIDATTAQTHAVKNLDAQIHAVKIDVTTAQTHAAAHLEVIALNLVAKTLAVHLTIEEVQADLKRQSTFVTTIRMRFA
jgi:hypothetical protein